MKKDILDIKFKYQLLCNINYMSASNRQANFFSYLAYGKVLIIAILLPIARIIGVQSIA